MTGSASAPWLRFLARRLSGLAVVLLGLVLVTFLMVRLIPGDPVRAVAGVGASPEQTAEIRGRLHLDDPLPQQFLHYVGGLVRGDLGESFETSEPVAEIIAQRLWQTVRLAVFALAGVLVVGVGFGLTVAIACRDGRRRGMDYLFTFTTSLTGSVPEYVAATLLVLLFGITLGWFPVAGADEPSSVVLPMLAVGIVPASALARIVRRETEVVLGQDYMRTALAKRLPKRRLYLRHALPNLLTSTLTIGGVLLAGLLSGAVVVENVFAWPGLGTRVVQAVLARDYPVIQGIVLMLGLTATIVNLLVDVLLGLLDPRSLLQDRR